jgi:hypothetical protein
MGGAPATPSTVHIRSPPRSSGRLTPGAAERDLLPLRQRQTEDSQATTASRPNPTRRDQPAGALLAIGASVDSGIADELTACHRRPEQLIHLRNHAIREPHQQQLRTRSVAITARTRGSAFGTFVFNSACSSVGRSWSPKVSERNSAIELGGRDPARATHHHPPGP